LISRNAVWILLKELFLIFIPKFLQDLMLSLCVIYFLYGQALASNADSYHDINQMSCLCAEANPITPQPTYYLSSFENTTQRHFQTKSDDTITLLPSQGFSTSINVTSNFTLSNFMASLSADSRIGPRPTNITGIEVQANYGHSLLSLLQNGFPHTIPLVFLAVLPVVFWAWV
jgi:hypothetical protein